MTSYSPLGPPALGRGLIIRPGDNLPFVCQYFPKVRIDASALANASATVETLHKYWLERRPVTVIVGVPDDAINRLIAQNAIESREPYQLGPRFDFVYERLAFLLTANKYDARSYQGTQQRPRWGPALAAVRTFGESRLKATSDFNGDVSDRSGRRFWVDDGPREILIPDDIGGLAQIPSESVKLRNLKALSGFTTPPVEAGMALDQLAAVLHGAGPARVSAPAGSGKTRVLTERLRYLRNSGVENVLGVAYNVRAQREMLERTTDIARVNIRTFNALGFAILNGTGGFAKTNWFTPSGLVVDNPGARDPERMLNELEMRKLIERLLNRLSIPIRREANTDPIAAYVEGLHSIRIAFMDPLEAEEKHEAQGLAELFPYYCEALRTGGVVDFDGQIYEAARLLMRDPRARAQAQDLGAHMLLDEFQDATPAHLLLARLMAAPGFTTFFVGDVDQVIYGYNGANSEYMLAPEPFFPGYRPYQLNTNYRCPAAVVDAVNNLLSWNDDRIAARIQAAPKKTIDPRSLEVLSVPGAGMVTALGIVQEWAAGGAAVEDIAVLARRKADLLPMQVALREAKIPCIGPITPKFLDRTGVSAALAYLRIATNPKKVRWSDLERARKRSGRFAQGPGWRDAGEKSNTTSLKQVSDTTSGYLMEEFVRNLEDLADAAKRGASTSTLLTMVREQYGMDESLKKLDASKGAGAEDAHLADLRALEEVAEYHPNPKDFEKWLNDILSNPGNEPGVTLATVHATKGLEWPRVIVYGANKGTFPDERADLEEERRIFHVAITRTQVACKVLVTGADPSLFVQEMREARVLEVTPEVTVTPVIARENRGATRPPYERVAHKGGGFEMG